MNKEEIEAIEIVKEIRKSDLMSAEFDIEELYNAIQTTLNLIDKLKKENEELKEQRKELNLENQALYESINLEDSEYLVKKYQKLKEENKKLKRENEELKEDNKKLCAEISDLKELLGE